jgi:hypothetical protein
VAFDRDASAPRRHRAEEESHQGEAGRQDARDHHPGEPGNALEALLRAVLRKVRLGLQGLPQEVARQDRLAALAVA